MNGWARGGCTPGFWGKSAEDIGRAEDRLDTKNERVRKGLKGKRAERRVSVERARRIGLTREPVYPPSPGSRGCAGIIRLTGGPHMYGNN